jgi:membrane protease YdiL (CAAX protease family)
MRPIGLAASLLWFGIPSLIFTLSLFVWLPALLARGYSPFVTFSLAFGMPLLLMLIAALLVYRLEGNPWTWPAFRARMRLRRMNGGDWLWTLVIIGVSFGVGGALQRLLGDSPVVRIYTPPSGFTNFMGQAMSGGSEWLGVSLPGNWGLLISYLAALFFFNILGEEFWWRGIILPRQEMALGSRAWIVNGVFWAAFHVFYHSTLASFLLMVPGTATLAYVCQRRRSTWPGIVAHFVQNIGLPIMLLRGILS